MTKKHSKDFPIFHFFPLSPHGDAKKVCRFYLKGHTISMTNERITYVIWDYFCIPWA